MKTDSEFKILFKKHAAELLALTGDRGARVLNVDSVEVRELRQAVGCVMKLEHEGQVYYRHIEFQAETRPDMALRCFRYNMPRSVMSEAEQVLLLFAGRYYTVEEVARVAGGRDVMIQSSVWQAAEAEGLAKGLTKGRLDAERELCADLVRELHPAIAGRVLPVIESSSDPSALKRWALLAAKGTDAELLKELGLA